MADHYAHPAPRDESQEEKCPTCGHIWEIEGVVEYGSWSPLEENDMNCPECGRNVLEV